MERPNLPANLTPAERFALVLKGLFAVSKQELAEALTNDPPPPQKTGRKPKKVEKPSR